MTTRRFRQEGTAQPNLEDARILALEQAVQLAAGRAPFERTEAAKVVENAKAFEEFLTRPEPEAPAD